MKNDFLHQAQFELAWPHFTYTQYNDTIVLVREIRALKLQGQLEGKYF